MSMSDTGNSEPFKIGLAGLGTVGVGVVKILQQHGEMIAARAGRKIEIVSVTASSKDKDRGVDLSAYDWAESLSDMAQDARLDGVIEMIGGADGMVKDFVESALAARKHVVSANKALLAHHGVALSKMAEDNGVSIGYEAAIAGGIPIVKAMREGLAANQLTSVYGILNGTCNYILTEMQNTGRAFDDVLAEAQEKGYAEADPTFDIDGIDAAHKLVLLAGLAFGVTPDFEGLDIEGIRHVDIADITYAKELGYRIKLIGMARFENGSYVQSVAPCLVPMKSALGQVDDVFNAVMSVGDYVDTSFMEGRGAGEGPTASSVVADIIDLARGNGRPVFGVASAALKQALWQNADAIAYRAYIHLRVDDHTGTLAEISSLLKEHDVSVKEMIQRGEDEPEATSLVILTHRAPLGAVKKAAAALEALPCVLDKPTFYRVEQL